MALPKSLRWLALNKTTQFQTSLPPETVIKTFRSLPHSQLNIYPESRRRREYYRAKVTHVDQVTIDGPYRLVPLRKSLQIVAKVQLQAAPPGPGTLVTVDSEIQKLSLWQFCFAFGLLMVFTVGVAIAENFPFNISIWFCSWSFFGSYGLLLLVFRMGEMRLLEVLKQALND